MNKQRLGLLALAVLCACSAEEGAVLTVRWVTAATTSCTFEPTSTLFQPIGFYDPSGSDAYLLTPVLRNNTASVVTDPLNGYGGRPVRAATDNITVLGYDLCWARADQPGVSSIDAAGDGQTLDCDKLPSSQKAFAPSSGEVAEGAGTTVASANILELAALQAPAIFGAAFDPDTIFAEANPAGTPIQNISFPSPVAPGRSAAWGNYPNDDIARLVVNFRAAGKLASGETVHSQWFSFPVNVCVFCAFRTCDTGFKQETCTGGGTGFTGQELDTLTSCEPFSGGPILCKDVSTCP